jgi:hypothetical protein
MKYEGRTHALRLLSDMFIALLKELQLRQEEMVKIEHYTHLDTLQLSTT